MMMVERAGLLALASLQLQEVDSEEAVRRKELEGVEVGVARWLTVLVMQMAVDVVDVVDVVDAVDVVDVVDAERSIMRGCRGEGKGREL